jgi:hypothetical protein
VTSTDSAAAALHEPSAAANDDTHALSAARRFWRWMLLMPFAGALAGPLLGNVGGILWVGLVFSLPVYLPMAALLWFLYGKAGSQRQLIALSVAAPPVFSLLCAIGFTFLDDPRLTYGERFVQLSAKFMPWFLGISGSYVCLSLLLYGLWRHIHRRRQQKQKPA